MPLVSAAALVVVSVAGCSSGGAHEPKESTITFYAVANGSIDFQLTAINPDGTHLGSVDLSPWYAEGDVDDASWSEDGQWLVFSKDSLDPACRLSECYQVWIAERDTAAPRALTPTSEDCYEPELSPDTSQVVFACATGDDGEPNQSHLWVINRNGDNRRRLTSTPRFDNQPTWSPDGTQIAFRNERSDIYVMDANGDNRHRISSTGRDSNPDWSPDGKKIVFWRSSEPDRVVTVRPDGTDETPLTGKIASAGEPSWSPDGEYIAYIRFYKIETDPDKLSRPPEVWRMEADGDNPVKLDLGDLYSHPRSPEWVKREVFVPVPP